MSVATRDLTAWLTDHALTADTLDPAAQLADLRAALSAVDDPDTYRKLRMEDYFMDVPVFEAFDAVAYLPETSCTGYVTRD